MELDKVLETRRSIRAYEAGRPVDRETVEKLIYAAQQAPTWKNSQTGRYYVIMSSDRMEEFRNACLPKGNAMKCAGAGALIVTAFEKGVSGFTAGGAAENELGDEWGAYDLGLQNENLVLKAAELGLGTLIMGIRDGGAVRKFLDIPKSQEVTSVISVGYPAENPAKKPRKDMADITMWL